MSCNYLNGTARALNQANTVPHSAYFGAFRSVISPLCQHSCRLRIKFISDTNMPKRSIDLKIKEQGHDWLLPPYNYSLRRVANELNVGHAIVHKWKD